MTMNKMKKKKEKKEMLKELRGMRTLEMQQSLWFGRFPSAYPESLRFRKK